MSFTPLEFNKTYTFYAEDVSKHEILESGYSRLACYADSFFACTRHNGIKTYGSNARDPDDYHRTPNTWTVTRFKRDELPPLGVAVLLTADKVIALQINQYGRSSRPDLSSYSFSVSREIIKGEMYFKVTMS